MRTSIRATLTSLVFTSLAGSGCAAHGSGQAVSALEPAQLERRAEQARVARLEARLTEFERAQARRDQAEIINAQRQVIERLDRLIALNEKVLEQERPDSQATEAEPAQAAPAQVEATPRAPFETGLSFKEKLKALMDELRDDPSPWRGGLSPEQNQALRVLLRPERSLDANNPWRSF